MERKRQTYTLNLLCCKPLNSFRPIMIYHTLNLAILLALSFFGNLCDPIVKLLILCIVIIIIINYLQLKYLAHAK